MDIMVRHAMLSDARGIADILRELGWFEYIVQEDITVTEARILERLILSKQDSSHAVYVAEGDDGRVMGYAAVHWLPYLLLQGLEGFISELFIREADRRHGVGSLLLETIKTDALQRGCSRLMLINLHKKESYHRQFYIKQGWEERELTANFILDLGANPESIRM